MTATFAREFDGGRLSAEAVHRSAFAHLAGEFATVRTSASLLGDERRRKERRRTPATSRDAAVEFM